MLNFIKIKRRSPIESSIAAKPRIKNVRENNERSSATKLSIAEILYKIIQRISALNKRTKKLFKLKKIEKKKFKKTTKKNLSN